MRDTTTVGQVLHNASASVHHASDTIMDIPDAGDGLEVFFEELGAPFQF